MQIGIDRAEREGCLLPERQEDGSRRKQKIIFYMKAGCRMSKQNIYDNDLFYENFEKIRSKEINFNDIIESSRSDAHFSFFFFAHICRTTFDGISIRTISDGVTFHCDPE